MAIGYVFFEMVNWILLTVGNHVEFTNIDCIDGKYLKAADGKGSIYLFF
jgi:hypothetical protein